MSTWKNISLQDANSFISEEMIFFYDLVMMMNWTIISMIMFSLWHILKNKIINRFMLQANLIEIIWTFIPMLILLFLSFPSLKLLYLTDEIYNPLLTIKVIGHQWYWSYEYSDFKLIQFDSYMIKELNNNSFRLLDVDNRMIFPILTSVRIIITSNDVIHSWTIPSLGIKIDAIPGRLNQTPAYAIRPGLYFGQCSEICGANHSFMPIVMECISYKKFLKWISNQ